MSIIKKIFGKKDKQATESEFRANVLKKATEHMNASGELAGAEESTGKKSVSAYADIDQVKKQNIRAVLLEIANRGEAGVLLNSISDKVAVNKQATSAALFFLTNEKYIEEVNSPSGMKYYLTEAGRKHCLSKEFNSGL